MGDAYSSFGRTMDLYASNFTCCGSRRKWRLRKPSVLFADEMMLVTCMFHERSLQRVTPKYFYD